MLVGFRLFAALEGHPDVVETYPHAVFRTLVGGPIAPKLTPEGRARRVTLLRAAGLRAPDLAASGHDALDAAAAALVALGVVDGSAVGVTCGHDGSAIWLPVT
jgi:predicted nuclease with RNAse H fold